MSENHVTDMMELTLEQIQNSGNMRFLQHILKLRIQECFDNKTYQVIYNNDELAAFMRWKWVDTEAVLEALLIRDIYRGQGYLDKLWKKFLEICKDKGVQKIISYAEKEDYLNLSFHEYLGFQMFDSHDSEKFIWFYDVGENEKCAKYCNNIFWLTIPDADGEL